MAKSPGLVLDVKIGDTLRIGEFCKVELLHKSGQYARLRISAPKSVDFELLKPAKTDDDEATGHQMWEKV